MNEKVIDIQRLFEYIKASDRKKWKNEELEQKMQKSVSDEYLKDKSSRKKNFIQGIKRTGRATNY